MRWPKLVAACMWQIPLGRLPDTEDVEPQLLMDKAVA